MNINEPKSQCLLLNTQYSWADIHYFANTDLQRGQWPLNSSDLLKKKFLFSLFILKVAILTRSNEE